MLRDVSARKRTEEKLRKALEQEKELGDLKSRFVAMASHEFRTPLTTISSSVELLEYYADKMNPSQKSDHFSRIHSAIHYMIQILEDVLFFGKTEADSRIVDLAELNPIQLCQETLAAVQISADPRLTFVFSHTGSDEAILVDQTLTRHILTNLLSNAAKYSPDGGTITLELHCAPQKTVLRVSDQGIGIPAEDRARLGEPFYRGHNVNGIKGTGLGLAITQRAVTLQGGTLDIESEAGVGTSVTSVLPKRRPAACE